MILKYIFNQGENIMKRILYTLVLSILISSCKDNGVGTKKDQQLERLESKYKSVGIIHNNGLEHIYNGLKKTKIESRKKLYIVINNSGLDFLKQHYDTPILQKEALKSFSREFTNINSTLRTKKKNEMFNKNIYSSNNLGSDQKAFLKKIIEVLKTNNDESVIKRKLEKINHEAADLFDSDAKLRPIVIATIVGKASFDYWQDNLEKWKRIVHKTGAYKTNTYNTISEYDSGETVAADVGAALGGLTWSAVTGCAELTGGACLASGAVGAGLVGSATDAAVQVYHEFF